MAKPNTMAIATKITTIFQIVLTVFWFIVRICHFYPICHFERQSRNRRSNVTEQLLFIRFLDFTPFRSK